MLPHPFEIRIIELAQREVQREAMHQADLRLASSGRPRSRGQAARTLRQALGAVLIMTGERLGGRRPPGGAAVAESSRSS